LTLAANEDRLIQQPISFHRERRNSYFQLLAVTSIFRSLSATRDIGRNLTIRFWRRFPFALAAMTVHDRDPFVPD
jgi:hypothetical protein